MQQEVNYEQTEDDFGYDGELPYFFSPSITKKRTINGKTYIIRSYFAGKKDFQETITQLAVRQAHKDVR